VSTPSAKYPDALKGTHLSGLVIIEGVVLLDGTVGYRRVMRATDPEFGQAAMEAVSRYRYKAATCGGTAVPSFVTATHRFTPQ
jgi:TonB family protein